MPLPVNWKEEDKFNALMKKNSQLEMENLSLRDEVTRLQHRLEKYEFIADALRTLLHE